MEDQSKTADPYNMVFAESSWSDLLTRTVDALARIVRVETRLFEITVKRMFEAQTERLLGLVFLLMELRYGSFCLLAGVVLLIHQWLAWWLAFSITGLVVIAVGISFQMITARMAAKESS